MIQIICVGNRQSSLSAMTGLSGNAMQQERATGNGLAPRIRVRQANEETPPVVGQGHAARGKLAAVQVVRGKATPVG